MRAVRRSFRRCLRVALLGSSVIAAMLPSAVVAHIEIVPADSTAGETQRYGIRVPTEKPVPTVRVEVQFPSGLRVLDFEASPGWQVTFQTDASGRPVDAVWEGGSIAAHQFAEFAVRAKNPDLDGDLRWAVIQTYQDGTEVQWVGPPTADFPVAITHVRRATLLEWMPALPTIAIVLSLIAIAISVLAWRAR